MVAFCYTVDLSGLGADSDGPAVRAVDSMGDWNHARDGDGTEDSRSVDLDFVCLSDIM